MQAGGASRLCARVIAFDADFEWRASKGKTAREVIGEFQPAPLKLGPLHATPLTAAASSAIMCGARIFAL
jgi:hypothetical protein